MTGGKGEPVDGSCPSCHAATGDGARFCPACGLRLLVDCPSCAATWPAEQRFCGDCGAALPSGRLPRPRPAAGSPSERRVVTVLFADLVGFTPAAEAAEPEDVRELVAGFLDAATRIVERYGGVVENFLGDGLMAVWGRPAAREDDAERAVRAGLDLVATVAAGGLDTAHVPVRVGVVTGEVAATTGVHRDGMVVGDTVNTAARVQAAAEPDSVLVDTATRERTDAAITYADAGEHRLKGKSEPLRLWRATQVVARVGGTERGDGLEPEFVGHARELLAVKELFHATVEDGAARLVTVAGTAGVGKSRLGWELKKYLDGLAVDVLWHAGRCLPYGDGVAFSALAQMVRGRLDIAEEDRPDAVADKLDQRLPRWLPDATERAFVQPRLAHLLGVADPTGSQPDELFGAWRRFIERLADVDPVVLVVDDLQWADDAMLSFLEELLDYGRDRRLFVLGLTRPDLAERRPDWLAGHHAHTQVFLSPLPAQRMDDLLTSLVSDLPADARTRIRDNADGIPLYAIETVRMLVDRGVVRLEDGRCRFVGPLDELSVPPTLHALVLARLDGLPAAERSLLQDAAVLGMSFSRAAAGQLSGLDEAELDRLLGRLVRKELLGLRSDPLSPDRGTFAFRQALVRRVAYERLSRRERRARHVAVAQWQAATFGEECAPIVASHYVDAHRAAAGDPDAEELRGLAVEWLTRAAARARSLAAPGEARSHHLLAAELSPDPLERARHIEAAGSMAELAALWEQARAHYEQAEAMWRAEGRELDAARTSARVGRTLWATGSLPQALARMSASYDVLADAQPDANLGMLAHEIGRVLFWLGRGSEALPHLDRALGLAEAYELPELLCNALMTKDLVLVGAGRRVEGQALLRHALRIALANDLTACAIRASINLASHSISDDEPDADILELGMTLARRAGAHWADELLRSNWVLLRLYAGAWDEVLEQTAAWVQEPGPHEYGLLLTEIHAARGDAVAAREVLERFASPERESDVQVLLYRLTAESAVLAVEGRGADALATATKAVHLSLESGLSTRNEGFRRAWVRAVDVALSLGLDGEAADLLAVLGVVAPGNVPPLLRAAHLRYGALVRLARGEQTDVDADLAAAEGVLRRLGYPFPLAQLLLDRAGRLRSAGDEAGALALLDEAHGLFRRLGATPYLERMAADGYGSAATMSRTGLRQPV